MSELKKISFEEESEDIKDRVTDYWTERADTFFEQRQHELDSPKAARWLGEIKKQLPGKDKLRILDVGCGAGYFPVLLGREGHDVTGIDLTQEMISKAEILIGQNGPYSGAVNAQVMDAEKLSFEDESFDVVITRNLTWTLPHPIEAYGEWHRVLKRGGVLLNFDAEYAKGAHNLNNQENLAHRVVSEELKDECHKIYHMLTISTLDRPEWDKEVLEGIGFSEVKVDKEFYSRIFAEKDEFYIPDKMFMIVAVK